MHQEEFLESIKLLRGLAAQGLKSSSPLEWRRNLESVLDLTAGWIDGSAVSGKEPSSDEDLLYRGKVEIYAGGFVLNRNKEILLTRRLEHGLWTLPTIRPEGNESPREATIRALREETGLEAVSHRCLAIFNARSHPHPSGIGNRLTLVYECRITGGRLSTGDKVLDAAFFPLNGLPELSAADILSSQLYMLYSLSAQKNLLTYSD